MNYNKFNCVKLVITECNRKFKFTFHILDDNENSLLYFISSSNFFRSGET